MIETTPFEGEEYILAFVATGLEVGSPNGEVGETGPDELAGRGEDVGCCLEGPVMGAVWVPGEGCDEEIAWRNGGVGGDSDV